MLPQKFTTLTLVNNLISLWANFFMSLKSTCTFICWHFLLYSVLYCPTWRSFCAHLVCRLCDWIYRLCPSFLRFSSTQNMWTRRSILLVCVFLMLLYRDSLQWHYSTVQDGYGLGWGSGLYLKSCFSENGFKSCLQKKIHYCGKTAMAKRTQAHDAMPLGVLVLLGAADRPCAAGCGLPIWIASPTRLAEHICH